MAIEEAHDRVGRQVKPATITDGRKVVAAAGTAEALTSSRTGVSYVIITAETNNTGVMAVGASTVVAAVGTRRGVPLSAGDSLSLGAVNLADVYIDAAISGDGVTYVFLT